MYSSRHNEAIASIIGMILALIFIVLLFCFIIWASRDDGNYKYTVYGVTMANSTGVTITKLEPDYRGRNWNPQFFKVDEFYAEQQDVVYLCTSSLKKCVLATNVADDEDSSIRPILVSGNVENIDTKSYITNKNGRFLTDVQLEHGTMVLLRCATEENNRLFGCVKVKK